MGVVVYGHWGPPLLVFPTSGGDEWEMDRQGMIGALADFIDAGRVKIFSINANSSDSFYNKGAHPFHRSYMQAQYDAYVRHEVVPFIHHQCQSQDIAISTMGASLGAYHAANTLFKHPDVFRRCYALSGRVRHEALHGRAVRRQLLLQQPRRLHGQHGRRARGACSTAARSTSRRAMGRGKTRARPTGWPGSWRARASGTRSTTGARSAATTGRTGSTRCASTSRAGRAAGNRGFGLR